MNLLWVGNNASRIGGQNRVTAYTVPELQRLGYHVTVAGKGPQVLDEGESAPCPHYPFSEYDPVENLHRIIEQVRPDVILCSHDVWTFFYIPELKAKYPQIKLVGWLTIDAHPIPASWNGILRAFDYLCTPTRFGRQTIYNRFPEKGVEVIRFGVDRQLYQIPPTYEVKQQTGRQLKRQFGEQNGISAFEDACVFVFAGANQVKKNIGAMVDAAALLRDPAVQLVLALKSSPCQIGTYKFDGEYELRDLQRHQNIHLISNSLADSSLVQLYQMADFLLYPSQGEAPGLQLSEAQLCGTIPIATDYTGMPEESCFPEFLIRDYVLIRGQFNCYRAMVGAEALASTMQQAVAFWKSLNGLDTTQNGLCTARYAQFEADVAERFRTRTWEQTARELDSVFQAVVRNQLRIDQELAIM